jgi:hypothetical protein
LFEPNRLSEQITEVFGHRLHTEVEIVFPFSGSTEVGHQYDLGTGFQRVLNAWQCGFYSCIAGDLSVFNRNIEVFTNKYTLAG